LLLNTHGVSAALPEFERAVALRPKDYFLWLELGRARDMADDEQGALAALEQSVRLAPEYAQPRWQFGNALFRAGRVETAYRELRLAALSDVALLPNLIDLVWGASGGDAAAVERIIQPEQAAWNLALAKFFIKRGKTAEGLTQLRAAGVFPDQDRQALLKDLLDAKRYKEAYNLWAFDSGDGGRESGNALINDGGFEGKLGRDAIGFGWRLTRDTQALRLTLDRANPRAGAQSLRVDFNGDSNAGQSIADQLILVEPGTRYRLRFAARSEEIVSGGLPLLAVSEVGAVETRVLAHSLPLQPGANEWQEYIIDFAAAKTTNALLISLRRQNCSTGPCPIFGRIWLDDFVLQEISGD
jgi:hypothetical protein